MQRSVNCGYLRAKTWMHGRRHDQMKGS
jgi:hypothetical protein